jgi:membrane associated rhomboid family serine protease
MLEATVGHQCPECVAEGKRTTRTARTTFGGTLAGRAGRVTTVLIGLNLAVFVLSLVVAGGAAIGGGSLFGGSTVLHLYGGVFGYGIALGEYHRLLTAMFLHFGPLHLLLNMYALWMLGRYLEAEVGRLRFAGLYLLAGFGGNVAVYLFADPRQLSAGASTAVFGLFAALFVLLRRLRRDTSQIVVVLVINLVLTFTVPGISIAGHLGGMVTGALLGVGLAYAPQARRNAVQATVFGGVTVLLVLLVLVRTAMLLTG